MVFGSVKIKDIHNGYWLLDIKDIVNVWYSIFCINAKSQNLFPRWILEIRYCVRFTQYLISNILISNEISPLNIVDNFQMVLCMDFKKANCFLEFQIAKHRMFENQIAIHRIEFFDFFSSLCNMNT